jgi:hypothetical protein
MIRKIALGLFALILIACIAVFAMASTQADDYHVERSVTMAAPPEAVHAVLDDMRRFHEWSPWQKLDPAMKMDYAGPATGEGTSLHWVGNDKAGEGRMTITESTPPTSVGVKLEFVKPFPSVADVKYTIAPEGSGSKVTWAMDGKKDMMTKVMCVFVSMDAMIGKDFETGLASLSAVTASGAAPAVADSTAAPASGAH